MSCCDPCVADDKQVIGVCDQCESEINQDGQSIEDSCSYSPLECEKCGYQPCDWSC